MARLTLRRLNAMQEALNSRLAGEINAEFGPEFEIKREDYDAALEWVQAQIEKRESGNKGTKQ